MSARRPGAFGKRPKSPARSIGTDKNHFAERRRQGNVVAVEMPAVTMHVREGCEGGKGPLLQTEISGTLDTGNDQYLFTTCVPVCCGLCDDMVPAR